MSENDGLGGEKYRCIYQGTVLDVGDPLGIGRVALSIEGLLERSDWVLQVGNAGAGAKKRGALLVPPVGADVAVFFVGGNPDQPRYLPGYYGQGEAPGYLGGYDGAVVAPADAAKVPCLWDGDRYCILIDERPATARVLIRDKTTGDQLLVDGVNLGIEVLTSTMLQVKSLGALNLVANVLMLNGRVVLPSSEPI